MMFVLKNTIPRCLNIYKLKCFYKLDFSKPQTYFIKIKVGLQQFTDLPTLILIEKIKKKKEEANLCLSCTSIPYSLIRTLGGMPNRSFVSIPCRGQPQIWMVLSPLSGNSLMESLVSRLPSSVSRTKLLSLGPRLTNLYKRKKKQLIEIYPQKHLLYNLYIFKIWSI